MDHISFSKYHGTGNDFILVDNRRSVFKKKKKIVQWLCHRHFGIGSDGLILLEEDAQLDFNMVFYNPDGSPSFCGNGCRCIVMMAKELGIVSKEVDFRAIDGSHSATIRNHEVSVKMADTVLPSQVLNGVFLDTGSPHYVELVEDVNNLRINELSLDIRNNSQFGERGVNVNFLSEVRKGSIFVRTYERGVEAETFSCGTGATASAITYGLNKRINQVGVETRGGKLMVRFQEAENGVTDIHLIGPAIKVYEGVIKKLPSEFIS